MFSLVLMVAMSQGAATPAWETDHPRTANTNFLHADAHQLNRHGCRGGWYGCCGCYGGGYGCWGGCYGSGYGCWGGCYGGCYGGGGGCYGGCGGGYYYGGYAPMGYVSSGYYSPGYAGYAPSAGPGYYDNTGAPRAPAGGGARPGERTPTSPSGTQGKPDGEVRSDTAATLVVSLPAGATLKIDDYVSQSADTTRRFVSPPLERGSTYHYDLTAELMRDGKPVTVSKRVAMRPGETTRVTIDASGVTVAQK